MKLLIASDLHGSALYCAQLLDKMDSARAQRMLFLGDILYHGPRNDLPEGYAPKKVAAMLNERKNQLLCVRGNCEAEVDQMVLEFPVLADYAVLPLTNRMIYATHGHVYNADHLPPIMEGDVLLHGHTHVLKAEKREHFYLLNPGSVSLPKEGNPRTYAVLDEERFSIYDFDDHLIKEISLR